MRARIGFLAYRASAIAFLCSISLAAGLRESAPPNYVDLVVALIGASGVVVTVFGIWVAIIFPRFVASLGNGVPAENQNDAHRYKVLIESLYRSAATLSSCIFILIITSFFHANSNEYKIAFCFFALSCSLSLCESLFLSISSGELAASDAINNGIMVGVIRRRRRALKS